MSELYQTPIDVRFIFLLGSFTLGFLGSLGGWYNFYTDRRLFGAALIGSSWLLGILGVMAWLGMVP